MIRTKKVGIFQLYLKFRNLIVFLVTMPSKRALGYVPNRVMTRLCTQIVFKREWQGQTKQNRITHMLSLLSHIGFNFPEPLAWTIDKLLSETHINLYYTAYIFEARFHKGYMLYDGAPYDLGFLRGGKYSFFPFFTKNF